MKDLISQIAIRTFKLLKNVTHSSDLGLACYKTLTTIIRDCSYYKITPKQLKQLLDTLQLDLKELDVSTQKGQNIAFKLLKAIIWRHIMAPEINDIISRVSELILQNRNKT